MHRVEGRIDPTSAGCRAEVGPAGDGRSVCLACGRLGLSSSRDSSGESDEPAKVVPGSVSRPRLAKIAQGRPGRAAGGGNSSTCAGLRQEAMPATGSTIPRRPPGPEPGCPTCAIEPELGPIVVGNRAEIVEIRPVQDLKSHHHLHRANHQHADLAGHAIGLAQVFQVLFARRSGPVPTPVRRPRCDGRPIGDRPRSA